MTKKRTLLGVIATSTGLALLAFALHLGGHDDPAVKGKARAVVAGASAVGGGVLTFGVGRRLLGEQATERTRDDVA